VAVLDPGSFGFWGRFGLAVLAGWRISHLLAREDGPGAVMVRLRGVLARIGAQHWLDCFGCVSLWVAGLVAVWVVGWRAGWGVVWLAVAGAILLVDRVAGEAVVLRHLEQEADDGML
jgi:hypothetical protein